METEDGEIIGVDIKVANVSGTIGGLMESMNVEAIEDEVTIPLPNVKSKTLRFILLWAENHKGDREVPDDKRTNDISAWNKDFLAKLKQGKHKSILLNIYVFFIKLIQLKFNFLRRILL